MSEGSEYLRGPEKRRFDIATSLGALTLGSPAFVAGIGAATISSGSGKPFFSQERDNYQGGTFKIHKLRSLNDAKVAENKPGDYGTFDPRTGTIGKVLRLTGVDEFPQLVNVLEGSMSFIGPRPVTLSSLEVWHDADPVLFDEWREASREAKPGLLSPGTLVRKTTDDRNGELFIRSMRADLEYVTHASFNEDVRILGQAACKLVRLSKGFMNSPRPAQKPLSL